MRAHYAEQYQHETHAQTMTRLAESHAPLNKWCDKRLEIRIELDRQWRERRIREGLKRKMKSTFCREALS